MNASEALDRRAIKVRGLVQGVGFRPFAYGLAKGLGLRGFIRNERDGVRIEVEGPSGRLERFAAELAAAPPPRARIDSIRSEARPAMGEIDLRIERSADAGSGSAAVCPDIAACEACLAELRDPADRRHRYPFLSCSSCGPRLTIVSGTPYDRPRTTMAGFELCGRCAAEYEDAGDRRHHAQTTACADCGPSLRLLDARGGELAGHDGALAGAAEALADGRIVAVKGLGGYHLACDARNEAAVRRLRGRKRREDKAFAVMVRDAAAAAALCELSAEEQTLLESWRRPIVILRRRPDALVAPSVAPEEPSLGLICPYTPLHHELLRMVQAPLVMTSGNSSDEPITFEDEDALARLADAADLFLTHNRPIRTRCDDSVARVVGGRPLLLRRARGYAPAPIRLPVACEAPVLALGGQLKATFALGRGDQAFVSHHLGDLDDLKAYADYGRAVAHYERLFAIEPQVLVRDLHPDYATTRLALERAEREGLEVRAVQHHHAHMASVMADNGLTERVIGVCFDGAGYGTDGTIWGGEFLLGDYAGFERAAHLRSVPMPGGVSAALEPWRMALSYLTDAGETADLLRPRIAESSLRALAGRAAPMTSSCGRLFDAVASIVGARDRAGYEGQAAMRLESLALGETDSGGYPFTLDRLAVDTRPLIAAVAADARRGAAAPFIARRFHTTVVDLIAEVCLRLRERSGVEAVALSGGVFANSILAAEAPRRLAALGFRVYTHRQVPPNDGGLCLGQLAVAAAGGGLR